MLFVYLLTNAIIINNVAFLEKKDMISVLDIDIDKRVLTGLDRYNKGSHRIDDSICKRWNIWLKLIRFLHTIGIIMNKKNKIFPPLKNIFDSTI